MLDSVNIIFAEKNSSFGFNLWKSKICPNRGTLEAICPRERAYYQADQNGMKSIYLRCILKSYARAQSCLTLCDPMDCSPPGFSAHGNFKARILEQVAIFSSRGSSQARDQTASVSCIGRQILYHYTTKSYDQALKGQTGFYPGKQE